MGMWMTMRMTRGTMRHELGGGTPEITHDALLMLLQPSRPMRPPQKSTQSAPFIPGRAPLNDGRPIGQTCAPCAWHRS